MKKIFYTFWIVLFFIGIIIPLAHLNTDKVSTQENRTLAKFPKIKKDAHPNYDYGKEFESWLGDHFWGRNWLIKRHDKAVNRFNDTIENKKAIYFKKNGWMFSPHLDYAEISSEKINDFSQRFDKFNQFCQQHNIKLYVLVVPQKEKIYPEHILTYRFDPDQEEKYLKSVQPIKDKLGNQFIYPYLEFKEAKKQDFLFFKESHHWTEYGAYIGYRELMKAIASDFPDVPVPSLKDYKESKNKLIRDEWDREFNIGRTTEVLNIGAKYALKHILKDDYTYYDPIQPIIPETRNTEKYYTKYFKNPNKKAKHKVFLSGFSNNENLLQFLPYSFKEVNYYRLNGKKNRIKDYFKFLQRYKKDLLEYKPDILILTVSHNQLFKTSLWDVE